MRKYRLMYGSYKADEIELIAEIFRKHNVTYQITSHRTSRGLEFIHLESSVTIEEQTAIRQELAEMIRRKWNWGRMTFAPTV